MPRSDSCVLLFASRLCVWAPRPCWAYMWPQTVGKALFHAPMLHVSGPLLFCYAYLCVSMWPPSVCLMWPNPQCQSKVCDAARSLVSVLSVTNRCPPYHVAPLVCEQQGAEHAATQGCTRQDSHAQLYKPQNVVKLAMHANMHANCSSVCPVRPPSLSNM